MTDLALVESTALAPSVTTTEYLTNPTGGRLVAWAEAAKSAAYLGKGLASTSFVPVAFRGRPEECAAAILCGDELGLSPLASLRSIFVIGGTPGLYARTMVAVVQSLGHEVVVVTDTPAKVVVKGRRRGAGEWTTVEWTTERARRAGYVSNKKYETDPQAMLYARAASDVCRRIAADALLGIPYSVEELELEQPAPTTRVTRTTATTRVQREAAPEPVEPPFDEPVDMSTPVDVTDAVVIEDAEPVDEPTDELDTITDPQMRKMRVLLNEIGMKDKAAILAYVSGIVGHDVGSSKALTKSEAHSVIDALQGLADLAASAEPPFDDAT